MFGSLVVTAAVSVILVFTYELSLLRYVLIAIGFAVFVFLYRDFIIGFIKKRMN
jgi:hypothetical protein